MEKSSNQSTSIANVVEKWRSVKDQSLMGIKYRQEKNEVTPSVKLLGGGVSDPSFEYKAVPEIQDGKSLMEMFRATLFATTGAISEALGKHLVVQVQSASPCGREFAPIAEAITSALLEMSPKDSLEGVLLSQMIALHNQMMEFMQRAIKRDNFEQETDLNVNRYTKINRHFLKTLEVLMKYRKKGEQVVRVEHVQVNEGGKAMVGNFHLNQGCTQKNEGGPHGL